MAPNQPTEIYISYVHEDSELIEKLLEQLAPLKRQKLISIWTVGDVAPGTIDVISAVKEHLESAQVILLAISPNYLASDFCWDVEMIRAMERHEATTARVIPLILRPVNWIETPLAKLQALPRNTKPLTTWDNPDEAFREVAQEIQKSVAGLNQAPYIDLSSGKSIGSNHTYKVFISYSHSDEDAYSKLTNHLAGLQRQQIINIWSDKMIPPGAEWQQEIYQQLYSADIVIALLSPAYFASRFLQDFELKLALEQRAAKATWILPVIINPINLSSEHPISALQALPREGKPVSTWADPDEAWLDVVKALQNSVKILDENISISSEETEKSNLENSQLNLKTDNFPSAASQTVGSRISIGRYFDRGNACLKANEYAESLATVISNATGEVCFALFGHWGRGKTYLMKLVEEKIQKKEYECVWFSAWKYRSKPEIWIHLYETLRRKAISGDNWLVNLIRKSRIFIVKVGIEIVFIFIFLFSVSLAIPLGVIGIIVIPIIFTLGIAYSARLGISLFGTWNNLSKMTGLSKKTFQLAEHRDKLGLQEVIGEDLKILLAGWVGFGEKNRAFKRSCIRFWKRKYMVFYVILAAILSAVIHTSIEKTNSQLSKIGGFLSNFSSHSLYRDEFAWFLSTAEQISEQLLVSDLTSIIFPVFIFIALLLVLFLLIGFDLHKSKVLLIVDDLDRLPSDEILEIIESLKLLLEEEIHELIQIVIICERKALEKAILEKYSGLYDWKTRNSSKKLVEENIQKLFISHLHLPPLSSSEQKEVLANFIDYNPEDIVTYNQSDLSDKDRFSSINDNRLTLISKSDSSQNNFSTDEDFLGNLKEYMIHLPKNLNIRLPRRTTHKTLDSRAELEYHEKVALYQALDQLSEWVTLGPRAIHSFVFRYKLARELLRARGRNDIDASHLATSLATHLSKKSTESEIDQDMRDVLEEVA